MMGDEQSPDRRADLRVDSTGTVHPVGRDASQALRARVGEWSLLRGPPEVVLAVRSGDSGRPLRLAGEVRTPGALCDVVALVAQAGWGGELVVLQEEASRSIFFESGQVVSATTTAPGERLGEILWRFGAITREQLEEVVRTAERSGKRVGETAIELEFVGHDELFRMMARQIEEVFYGAVHVAQAMFYLFDRFDETRIGRRYHLSTGQLLMEAARRMDELRFFREKVPSDAWVPVPNAAGGRKPSPELAPLLEQCDGRRSVAEIGRRIGQLEFEVTRGVFQLAAAGLVAVTAPRPEGTAAIVETYNRAIVAIHAACDQAGSGRELRAGLEQFAMSTGVYVPLFSGAGPAEDGGLRAERIAQNVAAIGGDSGDDAWLAAQLLEHAGFALFHAGSLLPREAEATLNAGVAEILRPLRQPSEGATPSSLLPTPTMTQSRSSGLSLERGQDDAARFGEDPDP